MPVSYSHKKHRDARLHAAWDALPDSHFDGLGVPRAAAKATLAAMQGRLVLPGDDSYDQDRLLFNPLFNDYPVAIAFCATEADVTVVLAFARGLDLGFTVRSGGHCTAGFSSGSGVLLDVSALTSLVIDPLGLVATVGCGVKFGAFFQTLDAYGLHVPGGECPDVCVGGYVQGGGYGFTSVSFGMNCDNVLALRVMLADGAIVTASNAHNADLFWAMRGGTGGNFGVLLAVLYRLRPLGSVWGWAIAWPLDSLSGIAEASQALMLLQANYMRASICGADMTIQVSLCWQNWIDPTAPQPPPNTPLRPYLMARGLYLGDPAQGQALIRPLAALPGAILQWMQSASFLKMNDMLLNYPQGMPPIDVMPFEDKFSRYVSRDLTSAEWTQMLGYFAAAPANSAYGYLEFYGGAINSADPWLNAFSHRSCAFNLVMDVFWYENVDRKAREDFLLGWNKMVSAYWDGEIYQNYCNIVVPDYAANYWGPAYSLLQAIKAKYDPETAFAFRQQVEPPPPGQVPTGPASLLAALARPIDYGAAAWSG